MNHTSVLNFDVRVFRQAVRTIISQPNAIETMLVKYVPASYF